MPKQITSARIEGERKREGSRKSWTDEVEEHLKITEIRNGHAVSTDRKEWRTNAFGAKVHNEL